MKWLLVDVMYLCHRARWSTGSINTFDNGWTGLSYGVIQTLGSLRKKFQADITVLALDSKNSLRRNILPGYKASRRQNMTEEEAAEFKAFCEEVDRMHAELFPAAGYHNVVRVNGYEADDVIAKYAEMIKSPDTAIIISSDKDLLQCLRQGVELYTPGKDKVITALEFKEQYRIDPFMWASVKALAGCGTDEVPGIPGVGEKTAADYFNGRLRPGTARHELIENNIHFLKNNIKLVRLPFPGIVVPEIKLDSTGEISHRVAMAMMGVESTKKRGASDRTKDVALDAMDQYFQ